MNHFCDYVRYLIHIGHKQSECILSVINRDAINMILSYLLPDDFPYMPLLITTNLSPTIKENHQVISIDNLFPMKVIFHVGRLHLSLNAETMSILTGLMEEIASDNGKLYLSLLLNECIEVDNQEWRTETADAIDNKSWHLELNGNSVIANKDLPPNGWMPLFLQNREIYTNTNQRILYTTKL